MQALQDYECEYPRDAAMACAYRSGRYTMAAHFGVHCSTL
jgi:hypothetical protein